MSIAGNWTKPDAQKQTAFSLHEEPINLSGGAEIIAKSIKESNKKLKYEIDVEYPQLMGLLSPGFEKFNHEASRVALRDVSEFKKNLAEDKKDEDAADQSSMPASSLDIGYTVAVANDDVISVLFDIGTYYRGAAHPLSSSLVLNFDVKNRKLLKLADVFKPGSKYLQTISSFSIKDLKKQNQAQGADAMLDDQTIEHGAAASEENYQSWTITRKGLGITFDAYQVGPYAAGPQYVLVPYAVLKDMIDSGGVKVYPRDIEEIAAKHPAIREVAVFGIPHDKWGETPVAAVVLRQGEVVSADELQEWINGRVAARYQRVERVLIMQDFPRNAAGKTLKREMRAPFWEGREVKI